MADYFEIVYINTIEGNRANDLPYVVGKIRDWSWERSALVRWSYTQPQDLSALWGADLITLDWSSRNAKLAEQVCQQIRSSYPKTPIFVVKSDPGRTPNRDSFVNTDAFASLLSDENIATPERIADSFKEFDLVLPPVLLEMHPAEQDWATKTFIEWVGHERLALTIQKYFPNAREAYLTSVGGGWSEAKLCRLFIDNEENEYFLKFFTKREVYTSELSKHAEAKTWLGQATVELRLIPDIDGDITAQNEAFSDIYPPRFPVCYESASTRARPRGMLKTFYYDHADDFIEGAFKRLLEILATRQPLNESSEPPWSDSGKVGFRLTPQTKVNILETIQDLSLYGPPVIGGVEWDKINSTIQEFLYKGLPPKLYQPLPVTIGYTHGDPNPRNCLVHPENKHDLLLIDCGGYQPGGRLVSDLAMIERDIKLLLMGTEYNAGGFFDLDFTKLPGWCRAEGDSISRQLNYAPAPTGSDTAKRAYRLISYVRERAKQLSSTNDPEGRHYFAALLFWNLDILKYPAMRPTKKLLALYSAAEIICQLR